MHAAGLRGEVRRRLSGGIPAADDDHVLIAGTLGIARHRPVVHPGAAEAIYTLSLQLPPPGARRDDHRPSEYVLAIVEIHSQEPVRPVGQFDRPVKARQDRAETAGLERRRACQIRPTDPRREPESSFRYACSSGLTPGRPSLGHQRPQTLRATVYGRSEAGGTGPENDQVKTLPVDVRAQPKRAGTCAADGLRITSVA